MEGGMSRDVIMVLPVPSALLLCFAVFWRWALTTWWQDGCRESQNHTVSDWQHQQKSTFSLPIFMCRSQITFWLSSVSALFDQPESHDFAWWGERTHVAHEWWFKWHHLKWERTFPENQKKDDGESDWANENIMYSGLTFWDEVGRLWETDPGKVSSPAQRAEDQACPQKQRPFSLWSSLQFTKQRLSYHLLLRAL